MWRASLAVGAAAAVLLTGCAGTAVEELPPSALESMEALAAFAREQNDGELAPVVSTPHQHKIEHFVVLLKVGLEVACSVLPSLKTAVASCTAGEPRLRPHHRLHGPAGRRFRRDHVTEPQPPHRSVRAAALNRDWLRLAAPEAHPCSPPLQARSRGCA